jgi:hypothetical protein
VPDLNIIPRLPSVAGYASIVNGTYESVTHTHEQYDLDIGQLASGALDRLDLREVVTVPEYFLVPLQSVPGSIDDVHPALESFGSDPVLPRGFGASYNATPYPSYPGPRGALRTGQTASWFFGASIAPDSATLVLSTAAGTGTSVRFGTLTADGSTRWSAPVPVRPGARSVTAGLPSGSAVGLAVQVVGSLPSQRAVITVGGHPYELAGSLSSVLVPGPWRLAGFSEGFAVFTLRTPPIPISAATVTGGKRLSVDVVSSTTKSEEVRVVAPAAATVVRSVAYDSGWTGSVSVNGGPARAVPVTSFDLVQQIRIPPGDDLVTFHYRPPHLVVASILSAGATVFLVVLLARWLVRRRRTAGAPEDTAPAEVVVADVPAPIG